MLCDLTIPKFNAHTNAHIKSVLAVCTLFICLVGYTFNAAAAKEPLPSPQETVPLLLNSGEVQTAEAEISILLWFENGDIPYETLIKRPMPDWTWTYNELQVGNKYAAVTLSGHRTINKNEEINLYNWYIAMAPELAKTGGIVYIDERVAQTMDISAYLSKTNAHPAQWVSTDNLLSIAAHQNHFLTSVLAGQDKINIQLLSRGKNNTGQTVLAIPALLQEF